MKWMLSMLGLCMVLNAELIRNGMTETVYDDQTELTWTDSAELAVGWESLMQWSAAKSYCETLELGSADTHWRLPTMAELESIVDSGTYDPAMYMDDADGIDNDNGFEQTLSIQYWSSEPLSDGRVRTIDFTDGTEGEPHSGRSMAVRCVSDEPLEGKKYRFMPGLFHYILN